MQKLSTITFKAVASAVSAAAVSLWLVGCGQSTDQGAASGNDQQTANTAAGTSSSADNIARDVDNSGINKRDRDDQTLTPGDQGATEQDREITRKIRRAITQNDQLSTTAKNVKIITANGKVTLRGPVNSEAERGQIAAAAQQVAGAGSIDNQLEVKQTTTTEERK